MLDHYVGVDIGGTKTEVCLLALSNPNEFASAQLLTKKRMDTERTTSLSNFLDRLNSLTESILSTHHLTMNEIRGMGVGVPGSIDPKWGVMRAGSIPFFLNTPLEGAFRDHFHFKGALAFDNDANCFALAEAYFGAGKSWADRNQIKIKDLCMIGITLGTGVGGGIIVRGELLRGRRGGAGEVGHTTLVESGRPCYCGKRGCVEQYLSGKGFASMPLEEYQGHLISFLSNLSNCFDPHVIVLGGGVSHQAGIYDRILERLSHACFLTEDPPDVVPNERGDSSGVMGAGLLSFQAAIHEGVCNGVE